MTKSVNPKNILKALLLVALMGGSFWLGTETEYRYFSRLRGEPAPPPITDVIHQDVGKPDAVDFRIFWDAWRVIQEKYVARKDLNPQEMVYGALRGLFDSLGDSYTVFLTPDETQKFETSVSGQFEGIGIEIGKKKGILTVIAPLEGTPAKAAGLKAKDQILKISGTSTQDMALEEAVNLIRGPHDTTVTLTIFREGWEETKDFTITRNIIDVPAIAWKLLEDNSVAYLALYNFNEGTPERFQRAAMQILNSGADRMILDLRDNPGGFFEYAVDIAGWFIDRGEVVVKEDSGEGAFVCRHCRANGNEAFSKKKIVILVNGGTASAGEILAGALRDIRGVKLVGEKTFGKGSVQELVTLREDQASAKITIAKWLTPKEIQINDVGLEPDVVIKDEREERDSESDPQLKRAVEIVKTL